MKKPIGNIVENKYIRKPGRKTSAETAINKEIFYNALQKNLGLVLRATEVTNIPSVTHYYWLEHDPIYKLKVEKLIELKRDFVEKKLIGLVNKSEPSCVTFTAKCLLRKRGYDQSTEIKNADEGEFKINIPAEALKTALQAIYEAAEKESTNADSPA